MKAMIFAAGLGTRLKPLTDRIPKALVPVNGIPMLQHVILKLKQAGFTEIVINIHHFGEQSASCKPTRTSALRFVSAMKEKNCWIQAEASRKPFLSLAAMSLFWCIMWIYCQTPTWKPYTIITGKAQTMQPYWSANGKPHATCCSIKTMPAFAAG